eukprot:CAMPEP_0198201240 /NCGR_PEP_ID=MMETSP1445-20131203/3986_1 /TAXON_ID=36898 /ORGANISM="Pyramimonas sp., Strain CCMP2087" /LENGTH=49 /DNA_ID=CAMNT_0043871451 /DNA_START=55 /DNA_END=204 /DNA_ORIENTATION=+
MSNVHLAMSSLPLTLTLIPQPYDTQGDATTKQPHAPLDSRTKMNQMWDG